MTGKQIVNLARKQLGNKYHKYCKAFGKNTLWCQIFMWWLLSYKSGIPYLKDSFARHAAKWALKHWPRVRLKDARAGDVVFFTSEGPGNDTCKGKVTHVGIIRKKGGATYCNTIEGNSGPREKWRSNTVMMRRRSKKYTWGVFRPDYK